MSGGAGIAGTSDFSKYTVEFCYSGKECVSTSVTAVFGGQSGTKKCNKYNCETGPRGT